MRKRKKMVLFICILTLCCCTGMPVSAKTKNVTKKYKSTVTKMLSPFDKYLCAPIAYGKADKKFVFNDYTKTSMILYSPVVTVSYMERVNSVKSKCLPKMKLYFGSGTKFKLKKYKGHGYNMKLQYLFQNDRGRIQYTGGEYSEMDIPKGKVTQIVQTAKGRYTVTYKEYLTNNYCGYSSVYRGTYHVYLKKASNRFGFIITNIKLTKSVDWDGWSD